MKTILLTENEYRLVKRILRENKNLDFTKAFCEFVGFDDKHRFFKYDDNYYCYLTDEDIQIDVKNDIVTIIVENDFGGEFNLSDYDDMDSVCNDIFEYLGEFGFRSYDFPENILNGDTDRMIDYADGKMSL
ncbi:MAG: hypothetical protein MJZ34_04725 [Paludibacteraceae bacterium]|nr:hypothetical protein [Paludibacteraceae bacterium]